MGGGIMSEGKLCEQCKQTNVVDANYCVRCGRSFTGELATGVAAGQVVAIVLLIGGGLWAWFS